MYLVVDVEPLGVVTALDAEAALELQPVAIRCVSSNKATDTWQNIYDLHDPHT